MFIIAFFKQKFSLSSPLFFPISPLLLVLFWFPQTDSTFMCAVSYCSISFHHLFFSSHCPFYSSVAYTQFHLTYIYKHKLRSAYMQHLSLPHLICYFLVISFSANFTLLCAWIKFHCVCKYIYIYHILIIYSSFDGHKTIVSLTLT